MKHNKKYCLLSILSFLIFFILEITASGAGKIHQIKFSDNKLSVHAENISLGSLSAKIEKETGIKIAVNKDESERIISVRFQSLSLEDAFARILNKFNYAIIFGNNDAIQRVIIVGENEELLRLPVKEGKIISHSPPMITKPASNEGMEITHPPGGMDIEPPNKEGMKITPSSEKMVIEPPGKEGMEIAKPLNGNSPSGSP